MLAAVTLQAKAKKYKQFVAMTSFGSSLCCYSSTAWYYQDRKRLTRNNVSPPTPSLRNFEALRRQAEGPMRSVTLVDRKDETKIRAMGAE